MNLKTIEVFTLQAFDEILASHATLGLITTSFITRRLNFRRIEKNISFTKNINESKKGPSAVISSIEPREKNHPNRQVRRVYAQSISLCSILSTAD